MCNTNLADRDWDKIFDFLQGQKGIYIGAEEVCRKFVEAVLWILRTGAQITPTG